MSIPPLISRLPEEERAIVDLVSRVPLWSLHDLGDHVELRRGDVAILLSPGAPPHLRAPVVPEGLPWALAAFVYDAVVSTRGWFRWMRTAEEWRRPALRQYLPGWDQVVHWLEFAPRDLLDLTAEGYARLQPRVVTDDDARRAADELIGAIESRPHHRLSGLLSMVGAFEAEVIRGLLADGWEIGSFWGPVQMGVWHLDLRRGPLIVTFGMGRGFSEGVRIRHENFDGGSVSNGMPYASVWAIWARLSGEVDRALDPRVLHDVADQTAWRAVIEWMRTATSAELRALTSAYEVIVRRSWREPAHRESSAEQRIDEVERAIFDA